MDDGTCDEPGYEICSWYKYTGDVWGDCAQAEAYAKIAYNSYDIASKYKNPSYISILEKLSKDLVTRQILDLHDINHVSEFRDFSL